MRASRVAAAALLVTAFCSAAPTHATTIAPPRDLGELLRMSDAVVFAEAQNSWSEAGRSVPVTVTRFSTVRSIAGAPLPWSFEVEEVGGEIGDVIFAVAGVPRYAAGKRYLLFLAGAPGERWRSRIMAYGILVEDSRRDRLSPVPESLGMWVTTQDGYEPPVAYRRDALLAHLQMVALGQAWNGSQVADIQAAWEENHDDPPACQWLLAIGDSLPLRDFDFEIGGTLTIAPTTPGQTGIADGGTVAVASATAAWSNDDSTINYQPAAVHPTTITCSGSTDVAPGEAVFNDPCGDIANLSGCNGTLGFGGAFATGATQTFRGEQWHNITAPYMVVNNGAQCVGTLGFAEMMTHELGHSLGFGHHTDNTATMFGTLHNDGRGASLTATDQACAAYAYPYIAPSAFIRRQEFAALVLRAFVGAGHNPSCVEADYTDVTCGLTPYANFISDLKTRTITLGCNAGNTLYCPLDAVTREQAAMLWLKTQGITPAPCGGSTGYTDVACGDPFGPWIKELRVQGFTNGCNAGNTLFCPKDALTFDELSTFITLAGFPAPPGTP
jgi:hypothetical protein